MVWNDYEQWSEGIDDSVDSELFSYFFSLVNLKRILVLFSCSRVDIPSSTGVRFFALNPTSVS